MGLGTGCLVMELTRVLRILALESVEEIRFDPNCHCVPLHSVHSMAFHLECQMVAFQAMAILSQSLQWGVLAQLVPPLVPLAAVLASLVVLH